MKIIQKCPNCGKEFETGNGSHFHKYCSNECFRQDKKIGIKKHSNCVICGKSFELIWGKGTKTCSKECANKLKSQLLATKQEDKPTSICLNCGKTIYYNKYKQYKLELIPKFCDNQCYHEYLKTHGKEVFDHSKQIQESHEIRTCEMCGNEFSVYKKTKKRFCSDECRKKYQQTQEFKDKKNTTMIERYGVLSLGGDALKNKERYFGQRNEKYIQLCEKSNLELLEYVSMHVLKVRCKKCGKEFITNNLSYLPYEQIPCKQCGEEYKDYKPALKLYNFLEENNIEFIKNTRSIISPYEIDIYIPSVKLAIEINGNFWHSELCGKDKDYHLRKTKLCNEQGIKLIHIFEDEIEWKYEIVISRLKNILHLNTKKIYARECTIIEIDYKTKHEFLNSNHIQGDTLSSINIGLLYNNQLVSVMTFSKERTIYHTSAENNHYEMIRFANMLNTNVIGGFSKLLKYFNIHYKPDSIKTYADVRWSGYNPETTVYLKNHFSFQQYTKPNYWYMHKTDCLKRLHRYNFTKYSILKKNPTVDKTKTEWTLMQELGYNRIWDCGNMAFILKRE